MKVIIPAKGSSVRCKNKNWKEFHGGESLVEIKIKQLLSAFDSSDIFLSCEDERKKSFAEDHGINFVLRSPELCTSEVSWSEVVLGITSQIPSEEDEEICWVNVTSPLFSDFKSVVDKWQDVKCDHDSLVTCKQVGNYIVDGKGRPLNYHYGRWHSASENLPKWYSMELAIHIIPRNVSVKCAYHVGVNPYIYTIDEPSVDIDSEQEFWLAGLVYGAICGN